MRDENLAGIVEAILFVSGEAVNPADIAAALELPEKAVNQALDSLEGEYEKEARGLSIKRFGGKVQLTTKAECAPYIERVLQPIQRRSLSQSALETLSIIAYKQPVTRMEIEAIRGVGSDYAIQSLMNKRMVRELGRKDTLGRPILYGTTEQFLSHFGLKDLQELPEIPMGDEQTSFLEADQLSEAYIQGE
ncbi:MAG: SMC-Scp complex subunit ScpB [Clostridiales bacterium]|nr:SMC-Scp complex subunit ScpB [Clostridiales bacterium]